MILEAYRINFMCLPGKIRAISFLFYLCIYVSCSIPGKKLFIKRTPHERYGNQLTEAGLNETALGKLWFDAANKALVQPAPIQLPYKEIGYFAAEKPGAAGYRFSAKRGEKINVFVNTDSLNKLVLFADLWKSDTSQPEFLAAADTLNPNIEYEVKENLYYTLRIQPELLKSGKYTVLISASGSLAFPVPSESNPKIGSFWGDSRDAGSRKHEGIDIFGKFRTPVVAAADGHISGVRENTLGGKVVFLKPFGKDYTLYYAHLDSQLVKEGQNVRSGEMVGLMGNTGNAKYTSPHLHFGIYSVGSAIDPLPFVMQAKSNLSAITASLNILGSYGHVTRSTPILESFQSNSTTKGKIPAGTILRVTAAAANFYKVELPGGSRGFVNANAITHKGLARTYKTDSAIVLLEEALSNAAPKELIAAGSSLPVYGSYDNFYFVEYEGLQGWIKK